MYKQKDGSDSKVTEISESVAKEMEAACSCDLSAKYIGDGRLDCDSRSSSRVLFQARIISTTTVNSSELLHHMGEWAGEDPTLVVQGVQLVVSSKCSVSLKALGDDTCVSVNIPPTPTPLNPMDVDKPDRQGPQEGSAGSGGSSVIPVIAGVVGILLLAIIIIVGAVCLVTCLKRRAKPPRPRMQRYSIPPSKVA